MPPLTRDVVEIIWAQASAEGRLELVPGLVQLYAAEPLPVYWVLARATPEERREIVLELITHYERLELPVRDGVPADLQEIDLSRETLGALFAQLPYKVGCWWNPGEKRLYLAEANLQGAKLSKANLQGVHFLKANLQGCWLEKANLQGASLDAADLQQATLTDANLQGAILAQANFQKADLHRANFQGANLAGANLQEVIIFGANLQGARLAGAKLHEVDLTTCELRHIEIWSVHFDRTRLRWHQLGGMIGEEVNAQNSSGPAELRAESYMDAKDNYLLLKQNFEDIGDYEAASCAYRREREMERAEAGWRARAALRPHRSAVIRAQPPPALGPQLGEAAQQSSRWVGATAQWLLCDYGESVWRVLGWLGVVFVGCTTLFGLIHGVRVVETGVLTHELKDWALFSLGAMTTLTPPHLEAACDGAQVLAGLEALVAIGLTGLLGFVLGNRIRHS